MSIGTVTGFVAGLALFLTAIVMATDDYMIFWSGTSVIMVIGGTLANAFISYQGVYVLAAMKDIFTIYGHSKVNRNILMDEVKKVLEWADIVSKTGIVGLDQHLKDHKSDDHLVDYAIDILLSGYKPDNVRELLTNTIESAFERATLRVKVLENMAATAPAFGMIGTLVGLVIMLSQLDSNPAGIGAGLAIALLTTLYGVLAARLVFQPAGTKVLHREELLRMRNYILLELFVMLAEEKRPRYIHDCLRSFLDPDLIHRLRSEGPAAPAVDAPGAPKPT
jgi:chemotaxis protein MotA